MKMKLKKAQEKEKRKGCWGCKLCDVANEKYGRCIGGKCACHLLERRNFRFWGFVKEAIGLNDIGKKIKIDKVGTKFRFVKGKPEVT